jgi:membrane-associated phospholipid phosphatase
MYRNLFYIFRKDKSIMLSRTIGIFSLFSFIFFSLTVYLAPLFFNFINTSVQLWVSELRSDFLIVSLSILTDLTEPVPVFLFLVLILLPLYHVKQLQVGIEFIASIITSISIVQISKKIFAVERPLQSFLIEANGFAYPSGHSAVAWAIVISVLLWLHSPLGNRWVSKNFSSTLLIVSIVLALCVSFSRLFFNVHTVEDVIAGALLGSAVSAVVYYLFNRR